MKSMEMLFWLLTTIILAVFRPARADTIVKLTQAELNSLVAREGLKFIHRDDLISWVDSCKNRGATDGMFVAAYSELALQNMNADEMSENAEKCRKALALIPSFTPDVTQLSNVVYIAENALSDKVRREAVWTYYSRTKGTDAFLDFTEKILFSKNLKVMAENKIVSCLYDDALLKKNEKSPWTRRVSLIMHRYAQTECKNLDAADELLIWFDSTYEGSSLRLSVVRRILDPKDSPCLKNPYVDKDRIIRKYKTVEENKGSK